MTAFTLKSGFQDAPLRPGLQLVLEAIDPTTGLAVAGVTSSRWSIYGSTGPANLKLTDEVPYYTPTAEGAG